MVSKIKQVIYVDVLFCLNMIISFFLLKTAAGLCRERTETFRVLLGSFMGGAYSLSIFLPEAGTLVNIISRVIFLLAVTVAVFGFHGRKRFFRIFACLSGVSLLLAGAVLGIWLAFRPQGLVIKNGSVYLDIGFITLVLFSAAVYILVLVFMRFFSRSTNDSCDCTADIHLNGKTVTLKGVIDTGNTLTDSFTGRKVSVIDRSAAFILFDSIIAENIFNGELPEGMHLTVSNTVGGEGLLPVFTAEKLTVKTVQGNAEIKNCAVAISSTDSFSDGISILVNAEVLQLLKESGGGEHCDKKTASANKRTDFKKTQQRRVLHKRSADITASAERKQGKRDNAAHRAGR